MQTNTRAIEREGKEKKIAKNRIISNIGQCNIECFKSIGLVNGLHWFDNNQTLARNSHISFHCFVHLIYVLVVLLAFFYFIHPVVMVVVVFFSSAFHFSLCSRAPHTHWRALSFKKSVNVCSLYDADCQCIHTFESVFLFVRWTIDALLASRWSLKYYNTSTIRNGISMFYISISIEFAHSFEHFIAMCATVVGLARFEHCDWVFVLQLWMDGIYFLSWCFFSSLDTHLWMNFVSLVASLGFSLKRFRLIPMSISLFYHGNRIIYSDSV